jgi:hypothetical protein
MFDDTSKANTKSYLQEIFEICGLTHQGEPYLMDTHSEKGYKWNLPTGKKIIGMNTGCGGRWTTRLWSIDKWVELVELVKKQPDSARKEVRTSPLFPLCTATSSCFKRKTWSLCSAISTSL